MVRPWLAAQPLPNGTTAILFGPGLAAEKLPPALKKEARAHWNKFPGPMIVDASALDWLEPGETHRAAVRVITPHPGEAGRLLGITAKEVQADRVAALRELSRRFGKCWVVLKGNHTLVGRASGAIFINSSGNPQLAQGGSGDLLAGYLTGLLAQTACQQDPLTAIRFAVWQHGASADETSHSGHLWTIEDLALNLGVERDHKKVPAEIAHERRAGTRKPWRT
jgi:NAD(P)H-hydrate epimerase